MVRTTNARTPNPGARVGPPGGDGSGAEDQVSDPVLWGEKADSLTTATSSVKVENTAYLKAACTASLWRTPGGRFSMVVEFDAATGSYVFTDRFYDRIYACLLPLFGVGGDGREVARTFDQSDVIVRKDISD
jgi:hypothetical protein